jgi:hypothetical protein
MLRWFYIGMIAIGVSACAVQSADKNSIVIKHTSAQPGLAKWAAEDHCAQYGKRAVFVVKAPRESSGLVPDTNVSVYDCVK